MRPVLQRHDLLRIEPSAWAHALQTRSDLSSQPMIAAWAERGWPVIVRRYLPIDVPECVPVAISLPPTPNKSGAALQLLPTDAVARLPPVPIRAGLDCAPSGWILVLQQLIEIGSRYDSEAQLFGSVLWQHLTGMNYLRETSDLDLIWPVRDHAHAQSLARAITQCEADAPMRIDGEFVLPDGTAVNWRELQQDAQEIIVKTLHRIECRSARNLFA